MGTTIAITGDYETDTLTIAQSAVPAIAWTFTGVDGSATDLSGKTIRFVAGIVDAPNIDGKFQYETGGGVVISGDSNNVVTVTFDPADTAEAGVLTCWLWNITDNLLLRKVILTIEPSLKLVV